MTQNLDTLRHSAAHIMARAVMRLYPNVQLAFGPNVENGFYYDFSMEHRLTEEDFPKIEAEMAKLIKLNEEFERIELPMQEAVELLTGIGQTLKVEHLTASLSGRYCGIV
jgi:threonyl-tRNA synthetase